MIRSLFAASGMLVRRRFRRDLGLLIVSALLLSFATLLAIAIPRSLESTIDSAARQAIDQIDDEADLVFTATVGTLVEGAGTAQQIADIARESPGLLPPALDTLTSTASATVITPRMDVDTTDGSRLNVQVAMLTDEQASQFRVQGRVPRADSTSIEVVISQETADVAALKIGSVLPIGFGASGLDLVVVGIIVPNEPASIDADPCLPVWCDLPYVWSPNELVTEDLVRTTTITVLADPLAVDKVAALTIEPTDAIVRIRPHGENATIGVLNQAITESKSLQSEASNLSGSTPVSLTVRTRFGDAFDGLSTEIHAAVAQVSLAVAGLLGVAAAVLVLLSRLLISRRAGELALERARGASLAAMVLRSLIESLLVTVVGVGFGLALSTELVASGIGDVTPLLVIAAVGLFAAPVQSALAARSVIRRQPANRSDRADIAARARLRRLIIELAIVVVAGAAMYTLRSRGVTAGTLDGIDPLVVTAPLLFAIVVTLVLIRVTPPVARLASRLGERSTGALGVLGAAQAGQKAAVLPLLALTLAFGLAVSGGLLLDTVRTGQIDASWQRVGADVRVLGKVTDEQVADIAGSTGVTAAGSFVSEGGIEIAGADTFIVGTVVAVDEGYAEVVESLPDYDGPPSALRDLSDDGDKLPIVVSSALAPRLTGDNLNLRYAGQNVLVRVVGVEDHGPRGYVSGPYVYLDRAALAERVNKPLVATTLLVMGPGATDAVADLDLTTLTRTGWLAERQHSALVSGVTTIMGWSSAAVALLALVTLVATVLATARGRGRTLSLLRTLGMRSRAGWWLALAELGPVVASALLGGILAGVGIVLAIAPALGLSVLAGGVGDPALHISPVLVISVVVGALALLAIAVVVEMIAHRRDRLSEVLRVGETV